jgi:hypothetical protein
VFHDRPILCRIRKPLPEWYRLACQGKLISGSQRLRQHVVTSPSGPHATFKSPISRGFEPPTHMRTRRLPGIGPDKTRLETTKLKGNRRLFVPPHCVRNKTRLLALSRYPRNMVGRDALAGILEVTRLSRALRFATNWNVQALHDGNSSTEKPKAVRRPLGTKSALLRGDIDGFAHRLVCV